MVKNHKEFKGQLLEQPVKQKIDAKDRKILYLLSKNARYSDTAIGKTLKIPREVVSYRIKQMTKKDFLHGFLTLIDSKRFGYKYYSVYIKFKQFANEKALIDYFNNLMEITRIETCAGNYDLMLVFTVRSAYEFDGVFEKIINEHSSNIESHLILEILEENFLGLDLLLSEAEKNDFAKFDKNIEKKGSSFQAELEDAKATKEHVALDEKDTQILEELKLNGRVPLSELSRKTELSIGSIENRMSNLIKEKVILGFVPYASLSHIGLQWWKVFFQVRNLDKTKFISYLRAHSNVLWYMKFVGKWNYQFSIYAKDNADFNRIVNEIRAQFPENIVSYESLIIFNQFKFVQRID